ncbi:MAG: lamin tail domain-containing protein [Planctomycetota bacterium]|nr:lamin tail domain-containing protein [Planctomycetota bacterium]
MIRAKRTRLSALMLLASIAGGSAAARQTNPIPEPHPQITEVFFSVPNNSTGDANADGVRHAAGDEFIEIANPHDRPINLAGYVLHNRRAGFAAESAKGVRFVFPDVELPPHAIAVVFNGCEARIPPPFGTSDAPPQGTNARFADALVFSMENRAQSNALANTADWLALVAPDGTLLDVVWWGDPQPPPPAGALRSQNVDANAKGSVQRLKPGAELEPHPGINGAPCSPGSIPRRTKPAPPKPATPTIPAR